MFGWYALQVRAGMEKIASAALGGKGYEDFLPLYAVQRRWSDRVKEVEVPIFPGYLFCRFDPLDRLVPVLTTPGVSRIVSAGRTPIPVVEEEIEALHRIVHSGLVAEPWPFLSAGCHIAIDRGPLAGLDGVLTRLDGGHRLVVSVSLLQRSVAVQVDRAWVREISNTARPDLLSKAPAFAI
ncbi:MAG: NusG-like protein [Acidobacteriia bacterium]|nr:NusG-like protein [Terriglobia bacterium]